MKIQCRSNLKKYEFLALGRSYSRKNVLFAVYGKNVYRPYQDKETHRAKVSPHIKATI